MSEPGRDHDPIEKLDFRLLGLEYALDESVPTLVGALVCHLARTGVLNLSEFEKDLRRDFDPNLRLEDSTGTMLSTLASLVKCYHEQGVESARYSPVLESQIETET